MMKAIPAALVLLTLAWPRCGSAGLVELARAGRWDAIVGLARARHRQLPLQPDEALVVAAAARHLGEHQLLLDALEQAAADPGQLGTVARVELAEMVVARQPRRAAELVEPVLTSAATPRLREAAVRILEVVAPHLESARRQALRRLASRLPETNRRRVELALAIPGDPYTPRQLRRLIEAGSGDGTALAAANRLLAAGALNSRSRWPAARALYRHALYAAAIPILEALDRRPPTGIPRWRVAFLRGRCAFRIGRWDEAALWYRRALAQCRRGSDRADLEVHLARARELGGDLEGALSAARRARSTRDSDDRRLFEVRLLLRLDRPAGAERVLASVRHRDDRERGKVLLALDALRRSRVDEARRRLEAVRGRVWQGPARILAARLALAGEDPAAALRLLEAAARAELDGFWSARAREMVAALPPPLLGALRAHVRAEVAGARGNAVDEVMARWARLEPDPGQLPPWLTRTAVQRSSETPGFPPGLARRLWDLGLPEEAARWDPDGFPDGDGALWSSGRLVELGETRRAIRLAESARARSWAGYPLATLPLDLRNRLYPLPEQLRTPLRELAGERGVPWPLLAGLVREESRWDASALSRVGARGLTQLMPATAELVAASVGQPPPDPQDLFRPAVALRLGSIELGRLLACFDGRWAPAVAAYNAGEAQARLWLAECGAGCSDERFILTVSFAATREYTARVLASAAMYAALDSDGSERGLAPVTGRSASPQASPGPAPASSRSPG